MSFSGMRRRKLVPVGAGWEQVAVGDENGCDTGAHDFKEADAAGAGSAGAEDEV